MKISWKGSLNCDGPLHQYQQTIQSLLILTEHTEHKITTTSYNVGNQGHGSGQAEKCGWVKHINVSYPNCRMWC